MPMTEAEWLDGWSYRRMYDVIREQATTRQVRLYMAACCRLKAAEYFDPRILRAVEAAERCAEDPQAEAAANAAWNELVTSPRPRLPQTGPEGELARVITDAWQLLDECWGGVRYRDARHAIAHAAFLCLRDRPRQVFTGGEGNAAEYCAQAIDHAESSLLGAKPEEVGQDDGPEMETEIRWAIANLLRDIFGDPFHRSPPLPPAVLAWNDGTVRRIAQGIYEERRLPEGTLDTARLAILADALLDAGCEDGALIEHCREPGPHVRGCWAVDAVLGKE
jgi:hypothetical protein